MLIVLSWWPSKPSRTYLLMAVIKQACSLVSIRIRGPARVITQMHFPVALRVRSPSVSHRLAPSEIQKRNQVSVSLAFAVFFNYINLITCFAVPLPYCQPLLWDGLTAYWEQLGKSLERWRLSSWYLGHIQRHTVRTKHNITAGSRPSVLWNN